MIVVLVLQQQGAIPNKRYERVFAPTRAMAVAKALLDSMPFARTTEEVSQLVI
jgi:hypothetical protein